MAMSSFALHRRPSHIFPSCLALMIPMAIAAGCSPEERVYDATGGGGASPSSSSSSSSGGEGGGTSSSSASSSSSSSGNPVKPGDLLSSQYFDSDMTLLFDLSVDMAGNSLLVGRFTGNLDFGSGPLGDAGNGDIFLARHGRDDKLILAKSYGGPGSAGIVRGTASPQGTMFVAGDISDMTSISFGGGTLMGPGVWQVGLGATASPLIFETMIPTGMSYLSPYQVAAGTNDASVFVGFYNGVLSIPGNNLMSLGDTDGYMIKYDPTGQIAWTRSVGGMGHDNISGVAITPDDSIYVTGYFTDSFMLGASGMGVMSAGGSDIFVAKFGPAGLPKWIRRIGGMSEEFIFGTIAVARNGDVVVASRAVGEISVESTVLPAVGECDIFIARYNTDGMLQWAQRYGDPANQFVDAITVDTDGNILLTGPFEGSMDFGSGPLMAPPGGGAYLAKLDPAGNPIFTRAIGGQMDAIRVAADGVSSVLLAGTGRNVTFELGMTKLPNGGIFLTRFAP